MSGGESCKHQEHWRVWAVTQRRCNHSAFNGYRWAASDYSEVRCPACSASWRTKAAYVDRLPDEE